jgi:hypothetical protein
MQAMQTMRHRCRVAASNRLSFASDESGTVQLQQGKAVGFTG